MDLQQGAINYLLANLPLAALFFWMYRHKDQRLEEKNDSFLEAYKRSTEVQAQLKGTIDNNTQAIRDNTHLTRDMFNVLNNRHEDL